MIKQECEAPGSDNDELYYDAEAEERDQALESEMPSNKDEYYRNNQIVGVASGWKCRSLIPIHKFIRMLDKNGHDATRTVDLNEDTYEQDIIELTCKKEEKLQGIDQQRKAKTEKNLIPLKFQIQDGKLESWQDRINSRDIEYGKKGWLDELMGQLPYKEDMNFTVDVDALKKMDVVK